MDRIQWARYDDWINSKLGNTTTWTIIGSIYDYSESDDIIQCISFLRAIKFFLMDFEI